MGEVRVKFIVEETLNMHDIVTEIYEALMDDERAEAYALLDRLGESVRVLKNDLLTKED